MTAIVSRKFPGTRLRRIRHDDFSRRTMRDSTLPVDDLILPVFFVQDGDNRRDVILSMPGVERLFIEQLTKTPANSLPWAFLPLPCFPLSMSSTIASLPKKPTMSRG